MAGFVLDRLNVMGLLISGREAEQAMGTQIWDAGNRSELSTISILICIWRLSKIVGLNEISYHVSKYRRQKVSGPLLFPSRKGER